MASRLSWFITPAGRNFTNISVGILGAGIFGGYVLPQTYFRKTFQEVIQMYRCGEAVPVPKEVQETADTVLAAFKTTADKSKDFSFFTVYGFDTFHIGSTQLIYGTLIGLPITFSYKSISDIDTSDLKLSNKEDFKWNSETGEQLLSSLVLSQNAQKFAIARELAYSDSYFLHMKAGLASFMFISTSFLCSFMNHSLNMYVRPRRFRFLLYGLFSCVGVTSYLMLKDCLVRSYDAYSDNTAIKMGKDYVNGGIEFYNQLLQRNKALRSALGKQGEKAFTTYGNVQEWIRCRSLPIIARRDHIIKYSQESATKPENVI